MSTIANNLVGKLVVNSTRIVSGVSFLKYTLMFCWLTLAAICKAIFTSYCIMCDWNIKASNEKIYIQIYDVALHGFCLLSSVVFCVENVLNCFLYYRKRGKFFIELHSLQLHHKIHLFYDVYNIATKQCSHILYWYFLIQLVVLDVIHVIHKNIRLLSLTNRLCFRFVPNNICYIRS